ncbi:PAS domain-containing sensor histidine kinase [Psychroserpens sp.]|uniref:PAS domain-containing sensor histidine kinase n=1 Tax=Psychroserpens sp. TaxID=2020870 RepID=UPI001B0F879C|nr:PAS domain-containing sensor histidine kinase [Psychroserpens sp.]MBO6607299.1 PAS domain-containing sensor histidine kinase [Psychroserpens sp.]MBO6654625.1 PAS domain-containing sensor histidine kinase [Psychroserpens sp.]MBO6681028.1 PAS domain-containing sensor histidine kinase [Psychroserpens sp.]MBO6750017.1 PAS domain-containing sensor histidine kinase [Psychroserpens sp.]MBO6915997.1 PAS domain-containing sensor histidine kinase [Psychroserpens sp.]
MLNYLKKHLRSLRQIQPKTQTQESSKWQIALEYSSIGLWEYDAEKDRVLFSNGSLQILGVDNYSFGQNPNDWNDRVHDDDKEKYHKDFKDHITHKTAMYENEHRVRCEDGSYKWIRDRGKVIEWQPNGSPKRIIGTHTDITSRIEREQKLEEYLQLITSQNKRLHNFTHIVSHNLKTNIGNFKNILEFYDDSDNNEEKEELIRHLHTISEGLTNTIIDLDDIISIKSKANAKQLDEVINISECVQKVVNNLDLEIDSNDVSVINKIDNDLNITANSAYLESIFYNLISNGIKYKHPERDAFVHLKSSESSNHIIIDIKDNGIGIDTKKFKDQLFEMYHTFHGTDRTDSKGIGLYITKIQAEAIGGHIDLKSVVNKGSTFTLTFKKQKSTP